MKRYFTYVLIALVFLSCSKDEDTVSFEEQLAIDEAKIDAYLSENDIQAETDPSGIRYVVNAEGDGDSPVVGDDIAVKYEVFFLDGERIDDDTLGFTLNLSSSVIDAWKIMVPQMKEGEKITIYTPSGYAFGATGNSVIPANSVLIYSIELIARVDDAAEQQEVDERIIDEYLTETNQDFEIDPSGIRFIVDTEGSGDSPAVDDEIQVKYEGRFLSGEVFDSNSTGVTFTLSSLIEAWKIMVPTMKVGGKITVYSPSRYSYGTTGTTGIAPNTVLVFEIELIGINP